MARRLSRAGAALVLLGIGFGLVAGCTSSENAGTGAPMAGSAGGAGEADMPPGPMAPPAVKGDQAPQQSQGQPQQRSEGQPVNQPGVDRKLVRTATLELAAPNVVEVANRARDIAVGMNGFAGQEEVRGESAMITLHIPSNRFDEALGQLSGLVSAENVKSRTQTAEDVTEQLVDVESRITTQRASVDRINALLARAQTVGEIVQIESEVTRRVADLESLEKRREALSGQVALSKVSVRVSRSGAPATPPPAVEDGDDGFLAGLTGGWNAFLSAGGVVLRVLGAVLPFVVVLGVPAALVLRWRLRRRAPAPAPVPAES